MSYRWSTAVWEASEAAGAQLLVLFSLADRANEEGVAWPRTSTIAEMARVTPRGARKALMNLSKRGFIKVLEMPTAFRSGKFQITEAGVVDIVHDLERRKREKASAQSAYGRPNQAERSSSREEPRSAREEPRSAREEPRSGGEEPRSGGEEPRSARAELRSGGAEPGSEPYSTERINELVRERVIEHVTEQKGGGAVPPWAPGMEPKTAEDGWAEVMLWFNEKLPPGASLSDASVAVLERMGGSMKMKVWREHPRELSFSRQEFLKLWLRTAS